MLVIPEVELVIAGYSSIGRTNDLYKCFFTLIEAEDIFLILLSVFLALVALIVGWSEEFLMLLKVYPSTVALLLILILMLLI